MTTLPARCVRALLCAGLLGITACGERDVVSLGRWTRRVKAEAHNAATETGSVRLSAYIAEHGLPDVSASVPLLFVGYDYTVGYDDIEMAVTRLIARGRP